MKNGRKATLGSTCAVDRFHPDRLPRTHNREWMTPTPSSAAGVIKVNGKNVSNSGEWVATSLHGKPGLP
jgi:hypothetical protein